MADLAPEDAAGIAAALNSRLGETSDSRFQTQTPALGCLEMRGFAVRHAVSASSAVGGSQPPFALSPKESFVARRSAEAIVGPRTGAVIAEEASPEKVGRGADDSAFGAPAASETEVERLAESIRCKAEAELSSRRAKYARALSAERLRSEAPLALCSFAEGVVSMQSGSASR